MFGHLSGLRFVDSKRLLTQNVFACIQGFDRPLAVMRMRDSYVDKFHIRISQQLVIRAVRPLKTIFLSKSLRAVKVPRRDRSALNIIISLIVPAIVLAIPPAPIIPIFSILLLRSAP